MAFIRKVLPAIVYSFSAVAAFVFADDAKYEIAPISSDEDRGVAVSPFVELQQFADKTPVVDWMGEPATDNAAAEATCAAQMRRYTECLPASDVEFDMIPIPGGAFLLGSPEDEPNRRDDEGPQVEMTIEPFWMGRCEVTFAEFGLYDYETVSMAAIHPGRREVNTSPAIRRRMERADAIAKPSIRYTDPFAGDRGQFTADLAEYPVSDVSHYAARRYCKWLSAATGHYYRLPTEAEWEYACRAGAKTAYSFGDDPGKLGEYAWFFDNSEDGYAPVGRKKPNRWGLCDMHGNLAEWCLDAYEPDRLQKLASGGNRTWPDLVDKRFPRVVRGGSWYDFPEALRSASRSNEDGTAPSNSDWIRQDPQMPKDPWYTTDAPFVGFRVVRPLRVPTADESRRFEGPPASNYVDEFSRPDTPRPESGHPAVGAESLSAPEPEPMRHNVSDALLYPE